MLCFNSQPFFSRFATDWSSDEVTLSGLDSAAVKRCKSCSSKMIIVRLSSNSGFSSKKVAKHLSQSIAKVSKFKFNDLTECAGITVPWCEYSGPPQKNRIALCPLYRYSLVETPICRISIQSFHGQLERRTHDLPSSFPKCPRRVDQHRRKPVWRPVHPHASHSVPAL